MYAPSDHSFHLPNTCGASIQDGRRCKLELPEVLGLTVVVQWWWWCIIIMVVHHHHGGASSGGGDEAHALIEIGHHVPSSLQVESRKSLPACRHGCSQCSWPNPLPFPIATPVRAGCSRWSSPGSNSLGPTCTAVFHSAGVDRKVPVNG